MPPVEMHSHAIENLRYIRDTMERATSFTAVPGGGAVLMGIAASIACLIAGRQSAFEAWLGVWLAAAVAAIGIGFVAELRYARSLGTPIWTAPTRWPMTNAASTPPTRICGGELGKGNAPVERSPSSRAEPRVSRARETLR